MVLTRWLHGKPMNDMPWEHISRYGTTFSCARCDFKAPIKVKLGVSLMEVADVDVLNRISVDISEMIGYHSKNVWSELNGFQGYDTIKYEFI